MLVIPFASLQPQPWRNGGGSTREIASGGSAGSPDWRLSIADLDKLIAALTEMKADHEAAKAPEPEVKKAANPAKPARKSK